MNFPLEIPEPLRRQLPPGTGVLLGVSGGVDSAVSLALLKALDCDVQCVTFKNFCYSEPEAELTEKSCCSLEAIDDARRLAGRFGSPHWVGDVEKNFRSAVITPFVDDYARATTPNPCLACNSTVRFPELVRLADRQGCAFAATGHYARTGEFDGATALMRGVDPEKDQSYFLHRIEPDLFPRLTFPLGWYRKTEVRRAARELGLAVAEKRDSQEICFVPDGDRSFLFAGQGDTPATRAGEIVNRRGEVLGSHRGLVHYTVGQRKGLGLSAPEPLYVLALDLAGGRVVVGNRAELLASHLDLVDFQPAVTAFPDQWDNESGARPVVAQIRHRHAGAPVGRWIRQGERLRIELTEAVEAVAPGQGCVLYQGDVVLGGGRLVHSREGSDG